MTDQLAWDESRLAVASDSRRTARYRRLQSWYRESHLHARHGTYAARGEVRPCGSLLHPDDVAAQPGLNFLSEEAARYARDRAVAVNAEGGSAEPMRLMHNMLSSMPLCFSIFGELRNREDRGLPVVQRALDTDAVAVELVECEWKPPGDLLGDRTAFDAVIVTEHGDGTRHLIGVETKYTEPLSRREYHSSRYEEVHHTSGWFVPHSIETLRTTRTNQLWRNALLAAAVEQYDEPISTAGVVVLALADDERAKDAVEGLQEALDAGYDDRCRFVSLEHLAQVAASEHSRDWAEDLSRQYLDVDAPTR